MTLETETFAAIIAVYAIIVISPGPNFVLVTQYSLRASIGLAIAITFGLAIGATINATLTMFGIGAFIVAYPAFGVVISVLGGGFLIFLGTSAIFAAVRERRLALASGGNAAGDTLVQGSEPAQNSLSETYLSAAQKGMLVNLLNPKGIVFFIGLYAPLVARASISTKLAVLVTSFFIEILWYGAVILFLSRRWFRGIYQRASFGFDTAMGLLLTMIGLRVMMEARSYLEAA